VSLPRLPQREHIPYGQLLGSVLGLVARERAVRWTLALGALGFGSFTMLWTALTPHLAGEPFTYSVRLIGLFGLVGLAGALAAQRAGHVHDRGWSLPATGAAWVLALLSWLVAWVFGSTVVGVLAAILLLDVVIQGQALLNGTRLFTLTSEARSRINTASVTCNFIAGAAGSALASVLFGVGGWSAVSAAGMVLAAVALGVWALGRRGPLVVGAAP
jgi:predicted MFS family arabinose efflux permease